MRQPLTNVGTTAYIHTDIMKNHVVSSVPRGRIPDGQQGTMIVKDLIFTIN